MSEFVLPMTFADVAEARQRIQVHAAEVRRDALSTERADRPRAENAIRELYRLRRLPEPSFLWVSSPGAGALAYAALAYERPLGPFRDIVEDRAARHVADQLNLGADEGIIARGDGGAALTALGLNPCAPSSDGIRAALPKELTRMTAQSLAVTPADVKTLSQLGQMVLGPDAQWFATLVGDEAFAAVMQAAPRRALLEAIAPLGRYKSILVAIQPGQFDTWTPFLASIERVLGPEVWGTDAERADVQPRLRCRMDLVASAGPWWALDGLAIVSERPLRINFDAAGRLHSATGAALAYGDGVALHAWHGVRVESWIIDEPERITVAAIDETRNAEVKRVMVERIGAERMVREGNAELVHEDETGRLWRRQIATGRGPVAEPIVMVEVVNSTPEPDGSHKTYWLRVPPGTETARQGVAWTFGMSASAYTPAQQS